ncbi:MAG TPA: TonB-dependent receptor [Candidatus Dormibacteraeota bacterium]|nr:TonB-dependent receptor [Candidatus Dormibacteraeota bacterium]
MHVFCRSIMLISICGLLVALGFAPALRAQVDTASIVGTVQDPSGAVVQGARITVTNLATNESQTISAGENGAYLFPYLRVGTYSITVEASGFKKAVVSDITLNVQDRKGVDITLEVGSAAEEVKVTESAPLLDTQGADVGHVIDAQQVADLPLNGRRYDELSLLTAGVNPAPGFVSRAEGTFSINGNSSTQNNFTLDGADNNSYTTNQQDQSTQSVQPAVDSLAEFKLQTRDYNVEYGRSAGGVINAAIKSGTNQLHGDVYEFIRNDKLDAKDFFAPPGQSLPFQQNQFGFTLGGPIRRNNTFFFINWEATRIRQAAPIIGTVPTPLMRQGNFTEFPADQVPTSPSIAPLAQFSNCINNGVMKSSCIDPTAALIFALYPTPNTNRSQEGVAGSFSGNNYATTVKNMRDSDEAAARIDHKFSDSDSVFGHFVVYDLRLFKPGIFTLTNPIADGTADSTSGNNLDRGTNVTMSWVHVFKPVLVNNAQFSFNRAASHSQQVPLGKNVYSQFGLKGIPDFPGITGGLPEFDVSGFAQLGSPMWLPQNQFAQVWQLKDTLVYVKGPHTIKTGVELRRDAVNFLDLCCNRGNLSFSGQYTGQGITDFLLGLPNHVELENLNVAHVYRNGLNAFAGDTWRATQRLTVNYGVRYEYSSPLIERDNHVTNFDPTANGGQGGLVTVAPNASGTFERTTVHPTRNHFAPRLGIAYQITPKLILRTGAGVYYENYYRYGSESQSALNPPFLVDAQLNRNSSQAPGIFLQNGFPSNFLNPVSITDIAAVSQLFIRAIDSHIVPSTIYQGSFGLQYSLAPTLMIETDYVWNRGRHLWSLTNVNQPNLITPGSAPVIPFPTFVSDGSPTTIEWLDSGLNSTYNALQVSLDKKMSRGLVFHVAYTWSKALSQASDFEAGLRGTQDRYRRNLDWGYWDNDTPHRLVTSFTYALPVGEGHAFNPSGVPGRILGGWQFNGIVTYASGQPLTIGITSDTSGANSGNRPDCTGKFTANFQQSLNGWVDPVGYATPAAFHFGNCSPTPGPRTPGISVWDMSLFKQIPITESKSFQFRVEAFNIWNKPQFGSPGNLQWNTNTGNNSPVPGFGVITSTRPGSTPRQLQLALKFYF